MRVWRLCQRGHAAFDGEGARAWGGRWNHPGQPVIYTASSQALAVLELLAHLESPSPPPGFVTIAADIPASLAIQNLSPHALPRNWRTFPAPLRLADLGSSWLASSKSAVLRVPSALAPQDWNYLLNPRHPEFKRIRVHAPELFRLDPRLPK